MRSNVRMEHHAKCIGVYGHVVFLTAERGTHTMGHEDQPDRMLVSWKHVRASDVELVVDTFKVPVDEAEFFRDEVGKETDMRSYVQAIIETIAALKHNGALARMGAKDMVEGLEILVGMDMHDLAHAWSISIDNRLRLPRQHRMPTAWLRDRRRGRKRERSSDPTLTQSSAVAEYDDESDEEDETDEEEYSDEDSSGDEDDTSGDDDDE